MPEQLPAPPPPPVVTKANATLCVTVPLVTRCTQHDAGPGPITPEQLPAPPPPPAAANADVTTLCALVSEATNADAARPDLWAWAARTSHWRVRFHGRTSVCVTRLYCPYKGQVANADAARPDL